MTNEPQPQKLLQISEAARLLGVSTQTLRNWADAGLVPHRLTPTGYRRFHPDDVRRMLEEMTVEPSPRPQRAKKAAAGSNPAAA